MGRLSVVATPIGNLDDISLRALATLRSADAIVAEDTRHTHKLCARHEIGVRLVSFHAHSNDATVARLVAELVRGAHLALVTDAGTPLVSDPGARLVRAAVDAGVTIEPIPGASAVMAALTVAALDVDEFRFVGFLPRSGTRRDRALERIARSDCAIVLFEAPPRLAGTLADLASVCGAERGAAVCRELTKMHEEVARNTLGALAQQFENGTRGEVTIVVAAAAEGEAPARPGDPPEPSADEVDAQIEAGLAAGTSARDVARKLTAEHGIARREAYRRVLSVRDRRVR